MGALRKCETEPEVRDGAGGDGESACNSGRTPRSRTLERGDDAENGSGNGNHDPRPVGVLRGAIAGESETVGGAVD